MRAINLYAGIGTMTRAFLSQRVEVIWAQEEMEAAAGVYRYNFPEIPFLNGALEQGMGQIPEHDLLLASIRSASGSLPVTDETGRRSDIAYAEGENGEKQAGLLGEVIKKYHPQAACIMLYGMQRGTKEAVHRLQGILHGEGYCTMWALLCGTEHGSVPFTGKRMYLVAFREKEKLEKFTFPRPRKRPMPTEAFLLRDIKQEERYYSVPGWCRELFQSGETKPGKIYGVLPGAGKSGKREILKEYDNCPVLTENSWYRTFVRDKAGVRRITPEEYLSMQGDRETRFPPEMSCRKIWNAMRYAGIYGIEEKIAYKIWQIAEGGYPYENIAEYLLREFDQEIFLYRKKAGMVCMPPETETMQTVKYLVQGIRKRTWGKWKIIVLERSRLLCWQMELLLLESGLLARMSTSLEDVTNFFTDQAEVLVLSYENWADYIRNVGPKGVHVGLVLLGVEADKGWRYLAGTEKCFPQAVYAGIASVPDPEAEEVFGPVRYHYTLKQAGEDHLMIPVDIEDLGDYQNAAEEQGDFSGLAEHIRNDMSSHSGKTLIIAATVFQAQYLQWRLRQMYAEAGENREISLCVSTQEEEEREIQLYMFSRGTQNGASRLTVSARGAEGGDGSRVQPPEEKKNPGNILITVEMWRNLWYPDIAQIYVLGRAGEQDLFRMISMVSRKYPGKEKGRIVISDQEVSERAFALMGADAESEKLVNFCEHLRREEYAEATADFERLRKSCGKLAEQLKKELEVLGDQKAAETGAQDKRRRMFMVGLWLSLAELSARWEETQNRKGRFSEEEEEQREKDGQEKDRQGEVTGQSFPEIRGPVFQSSAEKGAVLENALLRLLGCLFSWDPADNPELEKKTEAVLHSLRKRPGGDQNGRDLDLIYLDETGQRRYCYFECKYIHSRKLTEEMILAKIQQTRRSTAGEIEHWILVAPTGRLDKHAAELFEDAERMPGKYYPIKDIQVWDEERGVRELLSVEPELYAVFYGEQFDEGTNPENQSVGERQEILRKWRQKLMPVTLLPAGLHDYPGQSEKIMFELQNDTSVRMQYESLFQFRVKMSFYRDHLKVRQNGLEEDMMRWLLMDACRVRLLTGEYASGKTFFLYCLCRRLLAEFVKNPQKNYIPICISLKKLREVNSPAELIERRMKELGCSYADFYSLKEKFHVLVCLDGFDEITTVIDDRAILKNLRRLAACCELLAGTKILITSRPQCFEKNDVKKWLSDRLGGLEVLHLAPVEQEAGEQFVLFGTGEEERIIRWEQISGNRKVRELMEKPFFLDMIRLLLESGDITGESAVSVYEHYIRECLQRKFDGSFDREDTALPDRDDTVDRIYHALCTMAYRLQNLGEESIPVSEFEAYLGGQTAEILWMEENAGGDVRQDADNRFSMRTLLKYADAEGGRVEFSHRSIREYFTAVYLWGLFEKDQPEFEEELGKNYFSHEVLGFFAELACGKAAERAKVLHRLIKLVERENSERKLAAKIMQILYFSQIDRKIPEAAWFGKDLSGISIPGADLKGQNFRGTSFADANLNNVCLDYCDCSCCDMTGVRLGESGKILSLRYEDGELVCLYDDGCMRRWDMRDQEENSCIEGIPVLEQAVPGENGMLWLQSERRVRGILIRGDSFHIGQEYRKRRNRTLLSLSESLLLLKEESGQGTKLLLVSGKDGSLWREWEIKEGGLGTIADGKLAVVHDGERTVELFSLQDRRRCGMFEVEKKGKVIAMDVCLRAGELFVLIGYSDGTIRVCRYEDGRILAGMESRLYGLTHLAFCGNEIAALADSEGGIHQAFLDYGRGKIHMDWKEVMKLRISCRETKTEGLIPESIRLRLKDRARGMRQEKTMNRMAN